MQGRTTRAISVALVVSVVVTFFGVEGCGDGTIDVSTGSIQILTQTAAATAESSLDTDGYTVVMDSSTNLSVESEGTVTFDQVPAGQHVVELREMLDNCTTPTSPATITVESGATAQVSFAVTCWPPPSGRIVFTRYETVEGEAYPKSHIYTIDADGTGLQQVTENSWDLGPVWSPDGHKIAFYGSVTGLADDPGDVWVVNADGTGRTMLTDGNNADNSPAWSPDGSKIVFSSDRGGDLGIYVMGADGSGVEKLTDVGDLPSWSPDGAKIAYACDYDVCVMNSDGTGSVNLTNTGLVHEHTMPGSWSPDGTKILYRSDVHGPEVLYVMNADGTNQVGLFGVTGYSVLSGSWSPDGTKIAVSVAGFNHPSLYYVNADGTGLVRLTEDGSDRAPSWGSGS